MRDLSELDAVFVTPDSDWSSNVLVAKMTRRLIDRMVLAGVNALHVAPPSPDGSKVGVDDHLGKRRGTLDDLEVVTVLDDEDLSTWFTGRRDAAEQNEAVLRCLRHWCTRDGKVAAFDSEIAHATDLTHDQVNRTLLRLKRAKCIRSYAPTKREYNLVTGRWYNTPRQWLILPPKLIPPVKIQRLGDYW
jgi:hypothetical protein